MYWTDREKEAVYSANRLTGQDVTSLAEHLNDPHDIVVFHDLSQPAGVWTSTQLFILILSNFSYILTNAVQHKVCTPLYEIHFWVWFFF